MFSRILLVSFFVFFISFVCSTRTLAPSPDNSLERIYLVYVDPEVYPDNDCKKYQQLLENVLHERLLSKDVIVHCYKYVISGFAARLTEEEAEKLKGEKGVLNVSQDIIYNFDDPSYDSDEYSSNINY